MYIVTASSLNTYSSCPRKYQYKYMEEFESTLPQDALLIGSAVHIGIEQFWLGKTAAEMFESVEEYYRETPGFWGSEKGAVEKIKITAYLYGYIKERAEMLPLYEVLGGEEKWKTSAARDIEDPMSVFWAKLTFDTQVVMYLDAAQRKYGLKHRPRFIYDVIRKTKSKPSMTKRASRKKAETKFQFEARKASLTETLPQFKARVMKEYTTDPSRFMWREILITHDEVERRQDELFILEKQIQAAPLQYDLPRNPNSCLSAWGACPFFPVCAGQDDLSSSDRFRYKPAHSELKD